MNPGPRLAARLTVLAVAASTPGVPDGEYEITSYGRTLSVWCADMASTPVEYLTLQRGGPGVNVSQSNFNRLTPSDGGPPPRGARRRRPLACSPRGRRQHDAARACPPP